MTSASSNYALRLCEDALPAGGRCVLPPLNRVIYTRRGAVAVASPGRDAHVAEDRAWHGAAACEVTAEGAGATLWRRGPVARRPPPGLRAPGDESPDHDPAV